MMRLSFPLLVVFTAMAASAASGSWVPLEGNEAGARPDFVMLQHSSGGDLFEMRLPGFERSTAILNGKRWDRVEIPGGGYELERGKPEVPHVTRLLAIPARSGVRLEAEILSERTFEDVDLMPAQGRAVEEISEVAWSQETYQSDRFYPRTLVESGTPAIMRGVRLIPIQINPVRYNPVTKELRVAVRIRVHVTYEGEDLRNVLKCPPRRISPSWAKLMRPAVINFDDVIDVDESLVGSYLVVCPANNDLVSALDDILLDWKRRMGYSVVLETFNPGASNSDILDIIQAAYDTWDVPPEFVLLVGDDNGSYVLPGWNYYVGDHPYSQLDGDDILADVALGRLPAENYTEALTMFNKVIWYEKQPYTVQDDWFAHGLLVAGSSSSGLSTILTNRWIKTRMLENGYTQIDTMWYTMGGYPEIQAAIAAGINGGCSFFNYRGYAGMSGWDNEDTDNLTNGFMLPFVTTLTCGTGGFSGESSMEHLVAVGTPVMGQGAVACVGTATSGTNTRCNNAVDIGIYQGIFNEGLTQAGLALVRGKLELFFAYANINSGFVYDFSNWNNLAGDPGLDLWNGPIQYLQAEVPTDIFLGDNQLTILVADSAGNPVDSAVVCAYKEGETQSVSYTDENGSAYLIVDPQSPGNMKITITKHNYAPVLDSLEVLQTEVLLGYYSALVDDDTFGESDGDGDGTLNPGETVEIPVIIRNYGASVTATEVALAATLDDSLIQPGDLLETYEDVPPGATSVSLDDLDFRISTDAPNGHTIHLDLTMYCAQGSWTSALELTVLAPVLDVRRPLTAGGDSLLSPGETADLIVTILNTGGDDADSLSTVLRSLDDWITVSDSVAAFAPIPAGSSGVNQDDFFTVSASPDAPPGWKASMRLEAVTPRGVVLVDTFHLTIGEKDFNDPQGPDEYGYYCYDDTDLNYPPHPVFDWVEIDPDFGGEGIELALYDGGEDQDASLNIPLPFTFQYYGIPVDTITVCTNGWISMVPNAAFTHFRNWPIPSALGPDGMVAPFWDDLTTNNNGRVYAWDDTANHRVVIEWSRMPALGWPSPPETFEVILFDPAYYTTPTGDGEILFQYQDITQVTGNYWDNQYSTIGIESPDQTIGLEIVYSETYSQVTTAHPQNRRAYLFTTRFDYTPPSGDLQITLTPHDPPIMIPPSGGTFSYTTLLQNNTTAPLNTDVWFSVRLPDGSIYGPVSGPDNVTVAAGASLQRDRNQSVPGGAPEGTYLFIGYAGDYPSSIADSSFFEFTKTGVDASGSITGWENTGEPWDASATEANPEVPARFRVAEPYPNPFNPTTVINFDLPQAAKVTLDVFNVNGCRVEVGLGPTRLYPPGTHSITFDGSGLSSGVYFYRLQAGKYEATGKMVLMK